MASRANTISVAPGSAAPGSAAPGASDPRAERRQLVGLRRATTRRQRQQPQDARLRDISSYGCRLVVGEPHEAGERLWLRFTGSVPVAATVIWCDGATAGCRFDQPIPGTTLRSLTLAQD